MYCLWCIFMINDNELVTPVTCGKRDSLKYLSIVVCRISKRWGNYSGPPGDEGFIFVCLLRVITETWSCCLMDNVKDFTSQNRTQEPRSVCLSVSCPFMSLSIIGYMDPSSPARTRSQLGLWWGHSKSEKWPVLSKWTVQSNDVSSKIILSKGTKYTDHKQSPPFINYLARAQW